MDSLRPEHLHLKSVTDCLAVQEKAFLKTFKRGQSYIREHDVPGALAILLSGKMHIYKTDDFQRKQLLMVTVTLCHLVTTLM